MAASTSTIRYLSESLIKSLLDMKSLVPVIENALGRFSEKNSGGIVQPVRTVIPVEKHSGHLLVMPAYSEKDAGLGAKLVTLYPNNPAKGIPSHSAVIVMFNDETGKPEAVLAGDEITAMRTAAASAVAMKWLLPPSASVLCILGSSVQARSHFEAMREVMNISQVRIFSKTLANAERFGDVVRSAVPDTVVCKSIEDAVCNADVVVSVTSAEQPVVKGHSLKEGAVICGVGACKPEWREMDDEVMRNAVVTVDSRSAALQESGDIVLSGAEIFAEIGEIINGSKRIPPDHGKKFIFFKSLGLAIEDIATAKLVLQKDFESNS